MDSTSLLSSQSNSDDVKSYDSSYVPLNDPSSTTPSRRRLFIGTAIFVLLVLIASVVVYFVLSPSTPSTPTPSTVPLVTVAQGQLQGRVLDSGVFFFGAVPFAAPPIGSLRWRAPQPPSSWEGTRNATVQSPMCSQGSPVSGQEDCLYLNVFTQSVDMSGAQVGAPVPVLVFIHGGSSLFGSPNTDHQWLVADRRVVAVSVAYRVGVFGYLALDVLSRHSLEVTGRNVSGNYGLLDNIAALQWVRANIAQFGGDPKRVTIYGQSTGGTNVMALFISPLARGLFDAALSLSGSPVMKGSLAFASQQNADFLTQSGCAPSSNTSDADILQCMYALSPAAAYRAEPSAWKINSDFGLPNLLTPDAAVIVVDGYVVPLEINAALRGGFGANVTLVYGHMAQEVANSPVDRVPGMTQAQFTEFLLNRTGELGWSKNQSQMVVDHYPISDYNSDSQLTYDTIVNDVTACGGVVNLAHLANATRQPIFHYINHYHRANDFAAHGWDLSVFLANVNDTQTFIPRQIDTLRAWFVNELASRLTIKDPAVWPPFNQVQLGGGGNGTYTLEFLQGDSPALLTTHNWREDYCRRVREYGLGEAGWAN